MRASVFIIEPKAHRRLALVDVLREAFEVSPLGTIDGALRQIRANRPDIVLIGVGRRTGPALRLCRQIKTDAGSLSFVGLIDWGHSLRSPEGAVDECGCDGVFSGVPVASQALLFASELKKDAPTIQGEKRPAGLFKFLR